MMPQLPIRFRRGQRESGVQDGDKYRSLFEGGLLVDRDSNLRLVGSLGHPVTEQAATFLVARSCRTSRAVL